MSPFSAPSQVEATGFSGGGAVNGGSGATGAIPPTPDGAHGRRSRVKVLLDVGISPRLRSALSDALGGDVVETRSAPDEH